MTRAIAEKIEVKLDRVSEADDEEAIALLETVREDLGRLRQYADEETIERLEADLERHEKTFEHHEAYGGSLGAAMNPDEEDAA